MGRVALPNLERPNLLEARQRERCYRLKETTNNSMPGVDISAAITHWSEYARAKKALRDAGVVRSLKAAEADFSEWLIARLIGGTLPSSKSHPSCDVIGPGKRVQVKSVCKSADNPNGYIVSNRDRANDAATGASHFAFVFFNDLAPECAYMLPENIVRLWERRQIKRTDVENHEQAVRLWTSGENV
jgi:hypothetical protein